MSSGSMFEQLMKVDAQRKKTSEVDNILQSLVNVQIEGDPKTLSNITPSIVSTTPTRPSTPSSTPSSLAVYQKKEIAPSKNFHRVANSINKEAIEQGLFSRPSYKMVYDVLYLLSRGAIIPARKVRISKEVLQKKANIGSRVTLDAALAHLQTVGLVGINIIGGKQGGNEYEVFLPEEITPASTPTRDASTPTRGGTSISSPGQILEALEPLIYTPSSTRSELVNIEPKADPKTLSKTLQEEIDDEPPAAFAGFIKVFDELFQELTGKSIELKNRSKLKNLAEVLAQEIRVAADRTQAVSDVAAFATKHFSNRFFTARRREEQTNGSETKQIVSEPTKKLTKDRPRYVELCPDCFGSSYYNPDGKGMRPNCKHLRLEKKVSEMKAAGELSD